MRPTDTPASIRTTDGSLRATERSQCRPATERRDIRDGLVAERLRPRPSASGWVGASLIVLFALLAGCSGSATQPNADATSTASSAPDSSEAPGQSTTADAIDAITGGKAVALSTATLPAPPAGFTRAELKAFAERAIDLIRRGISPDIQGKTPGEAYNYVFANQYEATTDDTRERIEAVVGGNDWEWAWASMFETPPSEPARILASRWQIEKVRGTTSDGAPADVLRVTLSTAIEHLVPTQNGSGEILYQPVVVQRAVTVSGLEPLGGPAWWPGVAIQATALFDDNCVLTNGSILAPTSDPKVIRKDLRALRTFINRPKDINVGANSDPEDLDTFVKRHCAL